MSLLGAALIGVANATGPAEINGTALPNGSSVFSGALLSTESTIP